MKLVSLHNKFLSEDKIHSSDILRSIEPNLCGNGISSGQNIYTWHAHVNRDSHVNAESLHEAWNNTDEGKKMHSLVLLCVGGAIGQLYRLIFILYMSVWPHEPLNLMAIKSNMSKRIGPFRSNGDSGKTKIILLILCSDKE